MAAPVEAARMAAVRRYDILDTPPDGAYDRVAALAARLFEVPVATVTIVDEDRIWFKAAHGLEGVSEIARDPGLCASAVLTDDTTVIPDTLLDPVACSNPLVAGPMGYGSTPPLRSSPPTGTGWARSTSSTPAPARSARPMPPPSGTWPR
ncbi:hypothetical protein SAV14893_081280 [Streptomyces avermitilis]|uniref:GAF domain-containing protein n=1 Tax=Streptomyces avermitilis TaxID=33903 RepID=A0A4D4MA40_STRAX|nr:hypothetical protein [Streptomyces avermitilis]GDY68735.1 hypothetical protein SAV14893_081280 [Streptomyces avermitilis]